MHFLRALVEGQRLLHLAVKCEQNGCFSFSVVTVCRASRLPSISLDNSSLSAPLCSARTESLRLYALALVLCRGAAQVMTCWVGPALALLRARGRSMDAKCHQLCLWNRAFSRALFRIRIFASKGVQNVYSLASLCSYARRGQIMHKC